MSLSNGIYTIRNYRTRNHASLLRELGDIVACDGCYRAGEKWQVARVMENDRYEIRNFDKPEYYASCYHRPTPGQDVYLRGLPHRRLWTIREEGLGKPIDEDMKTYTIFADKSGGYWNSKTEEPNAHTILTRGPPNDSSLWIFEPVDVNGSAMLGQPCRLVSQHHPFRSTISHGISVQTVESETELRHNRVNDMNEEDIEKYFDRIPRVEGAAYNSSQRDFRTGCIGGTRELLLSTVHEWVQSPTPPLFWLNGFAGTGKTTIAHSVAEYYDERGQLGASFFFSRDQQDCRETRQVFRTIAHQLGKAYPEFKVCIADAIKNHDPLHSDSRIQFRKLITEPLRSFSSPSSAPIVIVLDALDESDDHMAAANIIELLATELSVASLPLKFFVTSRPEKDLRSRFLKEKIFSETQTMILHDIDIEVVQKDIKLFLHVKLSEIAEKHRDVIPQKPTKWPTPAEIDALTARAGGLFIFASTVVGFLDGSSYRAPERLSSILNAQPTASISNLNPYVNLDRLYHQILEQMLHAGPDLMEDTAAMFRRVVGTIVLLRDCISCEGLSALLNTPTTIVDVRGALMHLHSVIKVPNEDEADGQIEIFHQSFHDYLTDEARCTDDRLFINPPIQHRMIARTCLNAMMNSLESVLSDIIHKDKPPDNFEIPQWLLYARRHWTGHLLECPLDNELADLTHKFFSTMSLSWIMSLVISYFHPSHRNFMHCIEQAAQLGLTWSPFLSICLQRLGTSLCIRYRTYGDDNDLEIFLRCFTFASVLAVGLTPPDSLCDFTSASTDVLSPFSMLSFGKGSEMCQMSHEDEEWLKNASVRTAPGSVAQTVYYHVFGCSAYMDHSPAESVEWFQKALDLSGDGPGYELMRDMVAARCSAMRESEDIGEEQWHLPLHVLGKYIRSL